jgi:hypothetical protein
MSLYVLPYKAGSASAKSLAEGLSVPLLRKENSKFIGGPTKAVINWGGTAVSDQVAVSKVLNNPFYVQNATHKGKFFMNIGSFNGNYPSYAVSTPKAFYSFADAYHWWNGDHDNRVAMARTVLNGHSGAGIVELATASDWENFKLKYGNTCKLFTQYVKKNTEYRLHFTDFSSFGFGEPKIFFCQRKARKLGEEANFRVRNLANGFVYVTEQGSLEVPEAVSLVAQNFLQFNKMALKLNFGAIDIIFNSKYNKAYVLEVNTAPGLAGTTTLKYTEQFQNFRVKSGF